MTSTTEQRLNARGLFLDDTTGLDRDDEPSVNGLLVMRPDAAGGAVVNALIRPGLDPVERELFAEWVEQRIDRFFEHGPEPDGWQKRTSDGGWQMWARLVQMPSLD